MKSRIFLLLFTLSACYAQALTADEPTWWSTGIIYPPHEMDPNSEMYGFWASPGLKMVDGSTLHTGLAAEKYSFEITIASGWIDALGQALYYSRLTGRKPGIILITDESDSDKHITDLMAVIRQFDLPIAVVLCDNQSQIQ